MTEKCVDKGTREITRSRMHHHAGRFVYDDNIAVFIQYFKGDLFRNGHGRRGHWNFHYDALSSLQLEGGFFQYPVHSYKACLDEALYTGTGHVLSGLGDKNIETFLFSFKRVYKFFF